MRSLKRATEHWSLTIRGWPIYAGPLVDDQPTESKYVSRICDWIELFLSLQSLDAAKHFLPSTLHLNHHNEDGWSGVKIIEADTATRFWHTLAPLMPRLRTLVEKHGMAITDEPFASYIKSVVELYIANILGEKAASPALPVMSIINGWEIRSMADFLNDGNQETTVLTLSKDRLTSVLENIEKGTHLFIGREEGRIKDLLTFTTPEVASRLKREWSSTATKRPELMKCYAWETRVTAAKKFLDGIGDEDELKVIMGDRYGDLLDALRGPRPM